MRMFWKRFSILIGFGVLIALLISGTLVTQRRIVLQIKKDQRHTQTQLAVLKLEKAEALLQDAQSAQRGYLYTGDSKYLFRFEQAGNQVDPNLDTLAHLIADDPSQQESLTDLRNLSHSKLTELKQAIDLYQTGSRDDARAVVLSNRGAALISHVREIIDTMESREMPLEPERVSGDDQNARATLRWIYLSSGTAIACLALLAYLTLRATNRRQPPKAELAASQELSSNSTSTT